MNTESRVASFNSLTEILNERCSKPPAGQHENTDRNKARVQFNCEEQKNEEVHSSSDSWWIKWKVWIVVIVFTTLIGLTIGIGVFCSEKPKFYPYCDKEDFHCPSSGLCLSVKQLCDGVYDCNSKHIPHTWQFESWDAENYPELADEMGCYPPYCSAHDFQCSDGNCVPATLECDNKTDCLDTSDEKFCPIQPLPNGCGDKARDFPCGLNHSDGCIPLHFICNGLRDCPNGNDEQNCGLPNITKPPMSDITIRPNESFTISCEATGVPTPFIRWRHNLSSVPHHCYTTTLDGKGTLTCQIRKWDELGSYFCQAVNAFGSTFSLTSAQLHV